MTILYHSITQDRLGITVCYHGEFSQGELIQFIKRVFPNITQEWSIEYSNKRRVPDILGQVTLMAEITFNRELSDEELNAHLFEPESDEIPKSITDTEDRFVVVDGELINLRWVYYIGRIDFNTYKGHTSSGSFRIAFMNRDVLKVSYNELDYLRRKGVLPTPAVFDSAFYRNQKILDRLASEKARFQKSYDELRSLWTRNRAPLASISFNRNDEEMEADDFFLDTDKNK